MYTRNGRRTLHAIKFHAGRVWRVGIGDNGDATTEARHSADHRITGENRAPGETRGKI